MASAFSVDFRQLNACVILILPSGFAATFPGVGRSYALSYTRVIPVAPGARPGDASPVFGKLSPNLADTRRHCLPECRRLVTEFTWAFQKSGRDFTVCRLGN